MSRIVKGAGLSAGAGAEVLPKVIVILGPTASGKTELGIHLAKKFHGEIISADSRQVYRELTIGTGKPLGAWRRFKSGPAYVVKGVRHYLMDCLDPGQGFTPHQESIKLRPNFKDEALPIAMDRQPGSLRYGAGFTVAEFKHLALQHARDIAARGKVPLVVGGTGLYISTLVDNLEPPAVAPQPKLRTSLGQKPLPELAALLKQLDPASAAVVDLHNPRRVLRALEVVILSGESFQAQRRQGPPLVVPLLLGLRWEGEDLKQRIIGRVAGQFKAGLVAETERLLKRRYRSDIRGLSSIGYCEVAAYLQGECTLAEARRAVIKATTAYARRQNTWFKRDKRINWIRGDNWGAAQALVEKFLDLK